MQCHVLEFRGGMTEACPTVMAAYRTLRDNELTKTRKEHNSKASVLINAATANQMTFVQQKSLVVRTLPWRCGSLGAGVRDG